MRLDKFICNNSDYSRTQIHTLVKQGIICVNGEVVTKANYTICEDDLVSVNNVNITASGPRYFMLHKPQGYVCANSDSEHPTVLDLINEINKQELQIAGRLDLDTTGLVLLTDDGKWNHKITSPKHEHTKTYLVKTANAITQDTIVVFARGIILKNEKKPTLPAVLSIIDSHQARLEIHEGKYHQVKRMFAAVGNHVVSLHREAIGHIHLDHDLPERHYRPLTQTEIELFSKVEKHD